LIEQMIQTRYFILLAGLAFLFSGCAMILPLQRVTAESSDAKASVYINGESVLDGSKVYVRRRFPVVVSSYRYGYRPKSDLLLPNTLNPVLLWSVLAVGPNAVVSETPVGKVAAVSFVAIDVLVMGKKHKRKLAIGEMEKLPRNSNSQFRLKAFAGLDTLYVDNTSTKEYDKAKKFVKRTGAEDLYIDPDNAKDTLAIADMVEGYLELMGFQEPRAGLFVPYERTLQLDAEFTQMDLHTFDVSCHRREIEVMWNVRDHFGKKLYSVPVLAKSQVFSNFADGYIESFQDVVLDALIQLIDDPGFLELQEQMAQLLQKEQDSMSQLVLPTGLAKSSAKPDDLVKSQVTLIKGDAHASACLISSEGHILATYRILGQEEKIKVIFPNGKKMSAVVLRSDPLTNIVLLKADTSGTDFVRPLSKRSYQIGDDVLAVGTPVNKQLSQSLSAGIISAERSENGVTYLQTDVKVSRGANGSPLLNSKGELIGIVNEKYVGLGLEGLSFAISSVDIMERLKLSYSN